MNPPFSLFFFFLFFPFGRPFFFFFFISCTLRVDSNRWRIDSYSRVVIIDDEKKLIGRDRSMGNLKISFPGYLGLGELIG